MDSKERSLEASAAVGEVFALNRRIGGSLVQQWHKYESLIDCVFFPGFWLYWCIDTKLDFIIQENKAKKKKALFYFFDILTKDLLCWCLVGSKDNYSLCCIACLILLIILTQVWSSYISVAVLIICDYWRQNEYEAMT